MKINPLVITTIGIIVLLGAFLLSFIQLQSTKKEIFNYQNQRSNDSLMLDAYFHETDGIQKSLDSIMNMEETLRENNILKTSALDKLSAIQRIIKEKMGVIDGFEAKANKNKSIFPMHYVEIKKEELKMLQNRYLELEVYIKNLREERVSLKTKLDSALVKINSRSITVYNQKQSIENLEEDLSAVNKKLSEKDKQLNASKSSYSELKAKTAAYYYEIACNLKDDADKTWKLLNNDRKKARTKLAYSLFAKSQELGSPKAKEKIREIESDKVLSAYIK